MTVRRWLGVLAATALLAACADLPIDSAKFHQTWTKSYDVTTCLDWRSPMDAHQHFVMAADFLFVLRKRDGMTKLPPDDMIAEFETNLDSMCFAAYGDLGGKPTEAAGLIYGSNPSFHKP